MIEFIQANGIPMIVILFMLAVIVIGLRGGGEGTCGMAMHQQLRHPPQVAAEAEHPRKLPYSQIQSKRRTNL